MTQYAKLNPVVQTERSVKCEVCYRKQCITINPNEWDMALQGHYNEGKKHLRTLALTHVRTSPYLRASVRFRFVMFMRHF